MTFAYFMETALDQARRALGAGEFPVGCVITYDNEIIATGGRRGTAGKTLNFNEIHHAEMVALSQLSRIETEVKPERLTLYCTLEPCLMCLGALLINGINTIVYAYEDVMGGATTCNLKALAPLYREREVNIIPNVLRPESLKLFKTYFLKPENAYYRESLLARYTLSQ